MCSLIVRQEKLIFLLNNLLKNVTKISLVSNLLNFMRYLTTYGKNSDSEFDFKIFLLPLLNNKLLILMMLFAWNYEEQMLNCLVKVLKNLKNLKNLRENIRI